MITGQGRADSTLPGRLAAAKIGRFVWSSCTHARKPGPLDREARLQGQGRELVKVSIE